DEVLMAIVGEISGLHVHPGDHRAPGRSKGCFEGNAGGLADPPLASAAHPTGDIDHGNRRDDKIVADRPTPICEEQATIRPTGFDRSFRRAQDVAPDRTRSLIYDKTKLIA